MKKHIAIFLPVIAAVIALDQITKAVFLDKQYPFLSGFISIYNTGLQNLNNGAAWGFLQNVPWVLIIVAVVFIVAVLWFDIKFKGKDSAVYSVGLALVLGGTIGNLADRIFLGGVRDFLRFDFWADFPIFNLADSCILIGCILLVVYLLFLYKPKKQAETKK